MRSSKRSVHRRGKIARTLCIISCACAASLPANLPAQVQSLAAGNAAFALNLYAQVATNSGNIFFSPYSISTCMAMIYAGVRGNTEAQMSQVLGFDTNQQQFALTFGQLQSQLQADQQTNAIELNIANALWTQAGFPLLPAFLQTAANQYQASVNQADFVANPEPARQAINTWVEQETQNKIQNIVPAGAIDAATRVVLASAVYFKGAWTYTFEETNTSIQPFYLSSTNQVEAPLMHQPLANPGQVGREFKYTQADDFQALELPYGTNQISMLLLLPARIDGLEHLERQLSPSFLSNVLARMAAQEIEIFLPRFTNDSFFDLKATLTKMGISDAFATGLADFSGMDGRHDLFLSFLFHKAWVQVDEAGTEAAAATAGGGATSGRSPNPPPFRADHPFVFFIRDTQTGNLLFMGRLTSPNQSPPAPVPGPRLALTQSKGTLTVSWPYPSSPWDLEQSPDLSGTNWTPVIYRGPLATEWSFTGISTDGTNNLLPIFAPARNLFFRLRPR